MTSDARGRVLGAVLRERRSRRAARESRGTTDGPVSRRPSGRNTRNVLVGAAMLAGASRAEGERVAKRMLLERLPVSPEEFVWQVKSRLSTERARSRSLKPSVDDDPT